MARPPKDLGSYPQWMFEVAEKAKAKAAIEPLAMPDRKAAIATRHKFHQFRDKLGSVSEMRGLQEAANDLIVRITNIAPPGELGRYYLEFVPLGLAILADEARGSKRGIPSPLREQLPGVDDLLKQVDQEKAAQEDEMLQQALKQNAPTSDDPFERIMEGMLKKPK